MNRYSKIALVSLFALGGCIEDAKPQQPTVRAQQEQAAQRAANSITITDNQEIDNIKRRLELMSKPGGMQYIILLNQAGQPIAYYTVDGKVTSGGKRLTAPDKVERRDGGGQNWSYQMRQSPADNGVYGASGNYIFFWTTSGAYMQWSGDYLLSDQPIRLRVEPLVVNIK